MFRVRRAQERGHFNHGWLDTYHTFSFGDYHDPQHTHFRALRVMNEDRVKPGQGFGMHPHRDMEIVTYVLTGALEHKDSMGNGEVLRPGEFQRMSAGTGILHSEFNPSKTEPVHLYQIWLLPRRKGSTPSYEQRAFPEAEKQGRLRVVASPDGRDGSLTIGQDSSVFLSSLACEPACDARTGAGSSCVAASPPGSRRSQRRPSGRWRRSGRQRRAGRFRACHRTVRSDAV